MRVMLALIAAVRCSLMRLRLLVCLRTRLLTVMRGRSGTIA